MYAASFEYLRPSSVDEAIAMLMKHGDAAKLLAGGHSLIPAMKLRLARPEVVIDIGRIEALNIIRDEGGHFAIGAMTTHQEIAGSALLREKCPLLPETAAHIGDMQVRNRGTIGGSLAHADLEHRVISIGANRGERLTAGNCAPQYLRVDQRREYTIAIRGHEAGDRQLHWESRKHDAASASQHSAA